MAASTQQKNPSLAEDWSLPAKEQPAVEEEKPAGVVSEVAAEEKTEDASASNESTVSAGEAPASNENTVASEEKNETPEQAAEATEEAAAATEEAPEEQPEVPEIKIETAPADFRFPTTNQTRHCFTRYIEYHRCIAAKGEDAPECNKFAKYYRSLCPSEWVERWNEQRENGTFPGPL